MNIFHPTWLEIDTKAIEHNLSQLKKIVHYPNTDICGIVKTNAYGHGILEFTKILYKKGIKFFGVSSIEEAILLASNLNNDFKIIILGYIYPFNRFKEIIKFNNIIPNISGIEELKFLNEICKRNNCIKDFHLKIDTGMTRLGITINDIDNFLMQIPSLKYVNLTGVYTHFSCADCDKNYTLYQIKLFEQSIKKIKNFRFKNIKIHSANSSAILNFPQAHYNMVRPGLCLYGLLPFRNADKIISLRPVLSWKTRIVLIKNVPKGKYISYGNTYKTKRNSKIAIIPVGYGNGYNRLLSNRGKVLIKGKFAPIIGRITMDMSMIDITDIENAVLGQEVILIGKTDNKSISAETIAELINTINYEVVCNINFRIPRVYK